MKKLVLSVICISLAVFTLFSSSCSAGRAVKSRDGELDVVGKVGEYEVLYEELRYLTLKYRAQLEAAYGQGIWDNADLSEKYRGELEELVLNNITANYAILSLCKEAFITPELEDIQDAVKEYINGLVEQFGGRRAYIDALESEYLTDHFIRFSTAVDYCENELFYVYTDDLGLIETNNDKIYDYIMSDNFIRTLHVFIKNDAGDDIAENRKKAEEALAKIKSGTDIKSLIGSSYNEDFNLTTTNGYYFTKGEMIKEYEDAAFALNIGETSDIVETYSGFYIIERLPLESSYVLLNLDQLKQQYQYSELNSYIDERQAELKFEFNDYGRTLDLTKIK